MKDKPSYTNLLLQIVIGNPKGIRLIASGGGLKPFVADIAPYVCYLIDGKNNYDELCAYLTVLRTQEFTRPWTPAQVQKIADALKERSES